MRKWILFGAAALSLLFPMHAGAHQQEQAQQNQITLAPSVPNVIIKSEAYENEKALIRGSDCIVYGWFDSADQEAPTGHSVQNGSLVNFVQTFHTKKILKGDAKQLMRVLATGVEPLPDADDPLNHTYTGPIIEGQYVCFFKRVPGTDLYRLAAGWQGVYPIHDNKTIALQNEGFPQLGGLTIEQLEKRIAFASR
jgi:hypothetical protein